MMQSEFYLIWREGSNSGTPTYKHTSYDSARDECKRLTRLHGGTFYILRHVATATRNDVIFDELDDIPF